MKKILTFVLTTVICVFGADAATRDENATQRGKNTSVTTTQNTRSITNRSATKKSVSARTTGSVSVLKSRNATQNIATRTPMVQTAKLQRSATSKKQNVLSRAATNTGNANTAETRTGMAYEQCKTAFFTCMDQFCELKNDSFRRCSCNDRVFKYQEISDTYQNVSERLTEFTEDLDVVGLTKEQAIAMKTATEGEDALTEDKSASKQLLQAIMNAIKGEDSTVGGKYQNLNSLVISPDMSHAYGMNDYGQIIAAYNGNNLYKAVYPQCRNAVKDDCNDASLQRAVNAYLMAIEQDCNTVESALLKQQKSLKASKYESSAMLDLARIENRQTHNSDDIATCLANVESAVQSEEVCGAAYHKCLDNGQFIDVTTGAPLTGVQNFYELGNLLTFKSNENIQNQKLSMIAGNRKFVQFFEDKTKKFAKDALDKCAEQSDFVWQQYLDRALLDIYYAQQSKVKKIQNSCFDLVAACYDNQTAAIETAMQNLTGEHSINLQPAVIQLTQDLCDNYIESCNLMFAGDVIKDYMDKKTIYDSEKACRKIAQNCFESFGGPGYENFYSLQKGLITPGAALDWFTLYDHTDNDNVLSPCAQELQSTTGCNSKTVLVDVFGGFDKQVDGTYRSTETGYNRQLRSKGIASEIYSQIVANLSSQCEQIHGFFVEAQYAEYYGYGGGDDTDYCKIVDYGTTGESFEWSGSGKTLSAWYNFIPNEDMCPAGYAAKIDTKSWGICSCWENGNYRSKNGKSETCLPVLRMRDNTTADGTVCTRKIIPTYSLNDSASTTNWCQQNVHSSKGQICPDMFVKEEETANTHNILCASPSVYNNQNSPHNPISAVTNQHLHNQTNEDAGN
jgi:hypothetical protein